MVYEDGDPVGRLEISAKDREHIAGVAARTAAGAAVVVTPVAIIVIWIIQAADPAPKDWPLWAHALGWFALIFGVFFTWKRNSLLRERQQQYDAHNAVAREASPDGRTVPPRLADERPEG